MKGKIESFERIDDESFWGRRLGDVRSQGGRSYEYSAGMKKAVLQCLSRGIEATHVHSVLHYAAQGCGREPSAVPSLSKINAWRDHDLRVIVDRQIDEFVRTSTRLTLALDCASYSSYKYSAIGLINQDNDFILLDLVKSRKKSGDELFQQVIERLEHSGLFDSVVARLADILSGSLDTLKKPLRNPKTWQALL